MNEYNEMRLAAIVDPDTMPMPDDEQTPPCMGCGAKHVGMLSPTFLMLRGHYVMLEDQQLEAFVFDSNLKIEFFLMPGGSKACIVLVNPRNLTSAAIHDKCAFDLQKKITILEHYHMGTRDLERLEEDPFGARQESEDRRRMVRWDVEK